MGPQLRWVPVTDEHGRCHMEMFWFVPTAARTSKPIEQVATAA